MRLVLRVTISIFLFITISSAAIGYFAITKYQSSQINLIDDSLNSKIKELAATKEDSLKVAQYLAQVSSIPVTIEYLSGTGLVTVLTVSGPSIVKVPRTKILVKALKAAVSAQPDLRIRTFRMVGSKELILGESLTVINADVSKLTRQLILFILGVDLLAGLVAFLVFRRDSKLNQVSRLMAEQQSAMQRFLGDASHELRTPLTVIKGYVDLARNTTDMKRQDNYLEKSSGQIFRMESIIDDLLLLAEVGEMESDTVENIKLAVVLRDQVEVLQALQPLREITMEVGADLTVTGDKKLVERAIENIFSNVRRHTPEDAAVNIELSREGGTVTLVIEDGGAGLDEYPEKSRTLKRFTARRSVEGGGSGLGLSIISSVVERYHGSLHLSQSHLGGLRVEIKLPT